MVFRQISFVMAAGTFQRSIPGASFQTQARSPPPVRTAPPSGRYATAGAEDPFQMGGPTRSPEATSHRNTSFPALLKIMRFPSGLKTAL